MSRVTSIDSAIPADHDLDDPSLYLNRELTWLAFNRRVLAEAESQDNPLLEQLRFLAIFSSNLDEFFMKRIGGLKQQVGAGLARLSIDGRTPQQQIEECATEVAEALADCAFIQQELHLRLAEAGIFLESYELLDTSARASLRQQFERFVLPLVTPLAIDHAHPFPFVSNLSINLLVEARLPTESVRHLVRIKAPVSERIPRFIRIGQTERYVPLEDVIAGNLDLLLPGCEILSVDFFRVTRNAIVERNEELATDLLEMIEAELRERRFAPVVRLEVSPGMRTELRQYLASELSLSVEGDLYQTAGLLGASDLAEIAAIPRPDLKYPDFEPAPHPRLVGCASLFDELDDNGPLLLLHPYQSFDQSVTQLLREAVDDPSVLAIKTTVYRTSEDSHIVPLLVEAVTAGKQVAVVVELQARFDEAANIRWANRLEEAGIHVAYGVVGYKSHSKATLIVRQRPNGELRRYVHIGTGNYHSVTARQYCDIGLLTSDPLIGADATELFNLLTSGSIRARQYHRLLVSPMDMKKTLLDKIYREIHWHKQHGGGCIQLKTNALEDADITRALYEAGRVGVQVDLLVRDSCRLRPGIPSLSATIRVISILGRFLEHARLFYFRNNGAEEYFIGSADLMTRNLEHRVEALAPITDKDLQAELRVLIDLQLSDARGAWALDVDGQYQRVGNDPSAVHSQTAMIERAVQQLPRSRHPATDWPVTS
ncbi:MAG: polyphosphate kinase 1 [Pseudomonadota bacterium]